VKVQILYAQAQPSVELALIDLHAFIGEVEGGELIRWSAPDAMPFGDTCSKCPSDLLG
jgi:hypothetical protein